MILEILSFITSFLSEIDLNDLFKVVLSSLRQFLVNETSSQHMMTA